MEERREEAQSATIEFDMEQWRYTASRDSDSGDRRQEWSSEGRPITMEQPALQPAEQ